MEEKIIKLLEKCSGKVGFYYKDINTQKEIKYNENKKFIDDKTYTLSNIASVKTRIYETKHRGRKGRIRKSQHFVIDLFTHNNTKIVYPISFNDSNELHSRYKK